MVITGQRAGLRLRSPSQAPRPLGGLGGCWNQGTKSEPHSPSREQPAGMQLESGLAGAEGSPLSAPPRLPGLPGPSPIPRLTPSAHLLPAHHPRAPASHRLRAYLQPSAPTPSALPPFTSSITNCFLGSLFCSLFKIHGAFPGPFMLLF